MVNQIIAEIKIQKTTAEYAVSVVMRRYAATFASMTDRYFSERVKDIHDIERRLLKNLIGQKHEDLAHLTQDVVVIAHDLLPEPDRRSGPRAREGVCHRCRRAHQPHGDRRPRHGDSRGRRAWEISPAKSAAATSSSSTATAAWSSSTPIADQLAEYREARRQAGASSKPSWRRWRICRPKRWTGTRSACRRISNRPTISPMRCRRGAQGIGLYRTEFLYLTLRARADRGGSLHRLCRCAGERSPAGRW